MLTWVELDAMSDRLTRAAQDFRQNITGGTKEQWEAYDDMLRAARCLFSAARRLEFHAEQRARRG